MTISPHVLPKAKQHATFCQRQNNSGSEQEMQGFAPKVVQHVLVLSTDDSARGACLVVALLLCNQSAFFTVLPLCHLGAEE
jgi:hypothetical protein